MEWLIRLAETAIQTSPNYILIGTIYKGLKYVLAPFMPLYEVWIQEKAKDIQLKKETKRIQDNKLALLKFASELAQNVKGEYPEAVSNHCKNLLAIAQFTQKFINGEDEVSEGDVELEWIERFYNEAQYISDEKMQELWGRLMKEKIYRPSKVNKRLLSVIKDLDATELDYIGNNMRYFVNGSVPAKLAEEIQGFSSDILRLAGFGLVLPMQVKQTLSFDFDDPEDNNCLIEAKGYTFVFHKIGEENSLSYRCYSLTPEGDVLYNLVQNNMDEQSASIYLKFMTDLCKNKLSIEMKKT